MRSRFFCGGESVDAAVEVDVLLDRQILVERELLAHVADLGLDLLRLGRDVEAGDRARSGGRRQEAGEHPDRRRLAGPVRAEKAEDLAPPDVEGDPIDGHEVAEALLEVAQRNGDAVSWRWHGRFPPARSQHGHEDVLEGGVRWPHALDRDSLARQSRGDDGAGLVGLLRHDVHPLAEQAHGVPGQGSPERRRRRPRPVGTHLEEDAVDQPLQAMRSVDGEQAALVQQAHPRGPLGLVQVGGRDHDGHALLEELVEDAPEVAPRHRVDAVGRLVEEEHSRRVDQGAGQAELLLHAAREVSGEPLLERLHVGESQQLVDLLFAPLPCHAIDVGVEVQVLLHAEIGVEAEALAHVADLLLDRFGLAHRVQAEHAGAPAGRRHDPGEHPQGGGLAGPVGSDQDEDLAFGDLQGEVGHRDRLAEPLGQAVELDRVHDTAPAVVASSISASAGMPGLSSPAGLGTSILTR